MDAERQTHKDDDDDDDDYSEGQADDWSAPGDCSSAGGLSGRARRREFCLWVMGALSTAGLMALASKPYQDALSLVLIVILLIGTIRRLHDLGLSGWWALVIRAGSLAVGMVLERLGVPLADAGILLLAIVVLIALPGQPEWNRFGPPPGRRATQALVEP